MKSIYLKALLLSLGILAFSLTGFLIISRITTYRIFRPETPTGRNVNTQFEEATLEYENGGSKALQSYLNWQKRFYPTLNFYFTRHGRDLVSGVDRSQLLDKAKSKWSFLTLTSPLVIAASPTRNGDAFVIVLPPRDGAIFYVNYYLLLLVSLAILCWGLAIQFASPLQQLAQVVQRFGVGDLGARVSSNRRDAIGDVGRAFDQMADRIEKLVVAERRLLQDISHELRSPLARLSFAAELALASPDREAAAMRVHQEIEQLTKLVQSLLQVSREEGDLSAHRPESARLGRLLSEVVRDCEIEAAARGSRLALNVSREVELLGDPVLLRRAFENVLRNAMRYAPAATAIEVVLDAGVTSVSVTVRDYGPGVPEDLLTEIFRPFFRVDSSRDAGSGGVGLGLAITRRAIHAHAGQVWAENAHPGLRVYIELPLDRLSAKVQPAVPSTSAIEKVFSPGVAAYNLEPGTPLV